MCFFLRNRTSFHLNEHQSVSSGAKKNFFGYQTITTVFAAQEKCPSDIGTGVTRGFFADNSTASGA